MSNNYPQTSSFESNINLDEFVKCYICLCKIQDATMCPNCQKISCQRCIQKWLMERKNQCPHCRMPLKLSQIINILDNISTSKKQNRNELCKEHNISILYFCVNCNESLCSDCYMFGKKHKDHEINKLDQVYLTHVELIKNESKEIQKKFDTLNSYLKSINDKIISVGSYKLEKSNELEELFDNLKNKLENKVHGKLTRLMQCKNEISDKLKFLENIKYNVEKELLEAPKTVLISKSEDLIKNLKNSNYDKESLENKFAENVNLNISVEIPSDIFPQYESSIFEIPEYKKLILQFQNGGYPNNNSDSNNSAGNNPTHKNYKDKEFIYSSELMTCGLVWRIKVYPYGNGAAKGEYISIFLELIEGLSETSKYFYKIELFNYLLMNGDKRFTNYSREFSSDFTNGECWGYNRFYKIENLEKEGFIDPVNGKISIRFYVRPQTYSQLCRDQKNYILTVEKRLKYYQYAKGNKEEDIAINLNPINDENENKTQNNNHLKTPPNENIRTSEEIAINNFNMINNINNQCNNAEESAHEINDHVEEQKESRENEENNGIINLNNINQNAIDNLNTNNDNVNQNNNEKEIMEENVNFNQKENPNVDKKDNLINNENDNCFIPRNEEEIKVEPNNENEEVMITEINFKNINSAKNIDKNNALYNKSSSLKNQPKINFNLNKKAENMELKLLVANQYCDKITGNNLDMYDPDLSINGSPNNSIKFLSGTNNNNYFIAPKKNMSISDDGSSFGSLMDSIKLIEETSFQDKQKKNLKKIEKENEIADFMVGGGSNIDYHKKYLFNPSQSQTNASNAYKDNNNFNKNSTYKLDKEMRTSSDKLNDMMCGLFPENSFKFQKSNYKKYIQSGHLSSSRGINNNNNNTNYNQIKQSAGFGNNFYSNELEGTNFNNDSENFNDEKLKNMIFKKKK